MVHQKRHPHIAASADRRQDHQELAAAEQEEEEEARLEVLGERGRRIFGASESVAAP